MMMNWVDGSWSTSFSDTPIFPLEQYDDIIHGWCIMIDNDWQWFISIDNDWCMPTIIGHIITYNLMTSTGIWLIRPIGSIGGFTDGLAASGIKPNIKYGKYGCTRAYQGWGNIRDIFHRLVPPVVSWSITTITYRYCGWKKSCTTKRMIDTL